MENISRWDNIQEEFKAKVSEVARRYPKANYTALISFINLLPENNKGLKQIINGATLSDNASEKEEDSKSHRGN